MKINKLNVFNCRLAVCCLLATALLPACGGGSSSSGGGAGSPTFQRGYAAGTVATVDLVLADLNALQRSLAGSGAPAQTSRGTLGRSFALLEPRQRETLAASLLTFIGRVTEARNAAAADTAGRAEADAAQAAADDALRALQLVIAADTATRVGGGTAQTAAVAALNQIARVDVTTPGAQNQINEVLNNALRAAETQVAELERQLAAALAAAGQAGQAAGTAAAAIAALNQELASARTALTAARTAIRGGDTNPARSGLEAVTVEYFPRANAAGTLLTSANEKTGSNALAIPTDGVAYRAGATVLTAGTDAALEYPVRGSIFRNQLRATTSDSTRVISLYGSNQSTKYRLIRQGAADTRTLKSAASNTAWENSWARARTSIRFNAAGHPVMSHGSEPGEGYIFSDMELEQSTGCSNTTDLCNDFAMSDIRVSFGERTAGGTPGGEPARYWRKSVPWTRIDQDPNTPGVQDHPFYQWSKGTLPNACISNPTGSGCIVANAATAGKRAPDIGPPDRDSVYELLLSSYAGIDDGGTANDRTDDTARHLSYAAYGLWRFADAMGRQVGIAGAPFGYHPTGRFQTMHFGLDAFGAHNPLPTGAAGALQGAFEGATMGWVVLASARAGRRGGSPTGLTRLRGDVALTAHIGTAAGKTNRISGTIDNLEYWDGVIWDNGNETSEAPGSWNPRRSFHNLVITLAETDIGAQGAFNAATSTTSTTMAGGGSSGGALQQYDHSKFWGSGEYEGAFYGPVRGLEAAGTWFLPADGNADTGTGFGAGVHIDTVAGLVGSFGAACTEGCAPAP